MEIKEIILTDYSPVKADALKRPDNRPVNENELKQEVLKLCTEMWGRIKRGNCRLANLLDSGNTSHPEVFELRNGELWTRNCIGMFEFWHRDKETGEDTPVRVVITSRFDNNHHFFLKYLLENYFQESLLTLTGMEQGRRSELFESLMADRLASQLQRAWGKGVLRAYRRFDRNDSRGRGAVDIPRHIRENLALNNGRIACRIRSYSPDNNWNILFLQACAAIRQRNPALMRRMERHRPEFHAALQTLAREVPEWEQVPRKRLLELTRWKITNPIYRDYEEARLTARDILKWMGDGAGRGTAVTGVFLDMNTIWERLLETRLFRGAPGPFAQLPLKILSGHVEIRPDFLWPGPDIPDIKLPPNVPQRGLGVVLDAKNRMAWSKTLEIPGRWSESTLLSSEDQQAIQKNLRQVFTYMLALNCAQGGVIFPVSGRFAPIPDPIGPADCKFWRVPVYIPQETKNQEEKDCMDYSDFCAAMENVLDDLRKQDPIRKVLV